MKISINDLTSNLKNKINGSDISEQEVIEIIENNLTGQLSNLQTDNKNNIIEAVNELFQNAKIIIDNIGDVNQLETDAKIIVPAINELLDKLKGSTEGEGNEGIRFATGTGAWELTGRSNGTNSKTITYNLNFVPDIVICYLSNYVEISTKDDIATYRKGVFLSNTYPVKSIGYSGADIIRISDINNTSFTVTTEPCVYSTSEIYHIANLTSGTVITEWYAIGIGDTTPVYNNQIEPGYDFRLNTNITDWEVTDSETFYFTNKCYGGVTIEYMQTTRLEYNSGIGMTIIDVVRNGSPVSGLEIVTSTNATVNEFSWTSVSKNLTGLMPNDIIRITIKGGGNNPTLVKQFAITFNIV